MVSLQQEYIRGISAWNFNLEDLKNQAALVSSSTFLFDICPMPTGGNDFICQENVQLLYLTLSPALCCLQIQDYDVISNVEDPDGSNAALSHEVSLPMLKLSPHGSSTAVLWVFLGLFLNLCQMFKSTFCLFQDGFNDLSNLENSLASFPVQPLQALKYAIILLYSWFGHGRGQWYWIIFS